MQSSPRLETPNPPIIHCRAALGYLAVVAVLLHRLFLGEVLSPSANLWAEIPFRSLLRQGSRELDPYLNGIQGDVWREFEPWHRYQFESMRDGRFPLWNPHIFCGFPFHANAQSAMLSPFHWLYFLIDPKWAAGPAAALKLWVAGFGAFCLGRRLGMAPIGAFLAGTAWMLCAFNVRWLLWNHSMAAAWLPVMLITLDRVLDCFSLRRFAVACLAASALELSGHPESQFHVGALSALYVLLRVALSGPPVAARFRSLIACLAVHVIGLLGAAAALAPFLDEMRQSADWQESTHALRRHLPLEGLVGAVAPDHFGRPRAGRIYHGPLNYVEAGIYIGLVPLALAATAAARLVLQPRQTLRGPAGYAHVIFSVWVLLCGAVALGMPIVSDGLHRLPLFSKADNLRLIMGFQFGGAMLAGAAWTQLTQGPSRLLPWAWALASVLIAAVLVIVLALPGSGALQSHWQGLYQLWTDPSEPAPLEHRSLRTLVSFVLALVAAGCALAGARCLARRSAELVPRWLERAVLLLTLADLIWVAYGFNPIVPPHIVFPPIPETLARVVENSRNSRLVASDEILAPNLAMVYGFRDLRGYDFPLDPRWTELFRRLGWKPGITLLPRGQVVPCIRPDLQSICDKAAVRFLYTNVKQDELPTCDSPDSNEFVHAPWRAFAIGRGDDAVYENPTMYSRVYLARRVAAAAPEAALDALLRVEHDLRETSFVEDPVWAAEVGSTAQTAAGFDSVASGAEIEYDGDEEVRVRTRSDAARLLVLADRYDPNWRVEIDGRPAQSLRVNYVFRGVAVPAGEHLVRWHYRSTSFIYGCVISAATLIVLLTLTLVNRPKNLSENPSP